LVCNYCGKEFEKFLANRPKENKNHYCSRECVALNKNKIGIGTNYDCKQCGKEFSQIHKRHYFCSEECKSQYNTINAPKKLVQCSNCGKEIERLRWLKNKNYFCCKECESAFRENESDDVRNCETCGRDFYCKKGDKLRFCSYECQGIWQSETRTGKNSSGWKDEISDDMRIKKCEYCGKDMTGTPKSFEINKFCSKSCKLKANKKTLTHPHIMVCDYLNSEGIQNEIEYPINRFSLDNFLIEKSLGIEVNGTFWHCDVRFYESPISEYQTSGIKRDKRKKNLLIEKNISVLYLWEYDIENSFELCKRLMNLFIKNNGKLENYHSMNYRLDIDGLSIINKLFIPYAENDYIAPLTTGARETHYEMGVEQSEHTL
jgi:G:T-mismatch repair DNA endonuclease (very short patch repair protein)